jgi:hypothetical protein
VSCSSADASSRPSPGSFLLPLPDFVSSDLLSSAVSAPATDDTPDYAVITLSTERTLHAVDSCTLAAVTTTARRSPTVSMKMLRLRPTIADQGS